MYEIVRTEKKKQIIIINHDQIIKEKKKIITRDVTFA